MHETIVEHLRALPPSAVVLVAAMLPLVEARYAVAAGFGLGVPFWEAFGVAVFGNLVVILPVLLLLGRVSEWCRRFHWTSRFFDWLFARARKRKHLIDRYGALGLALFIAVPLPVTGAWTGAAVAFVFGIRFWHAALATLIGIVISAGLISAGTYGGVAAFSALAK